MKNRLESVCEEKGLRMTAQRRVIAHVLSGAQDHPDAERIFSRARAVDPNISIATIYRTVKIFEDAGILRRLDLGDGPIRYEEVSDTHHDHLIDTRSGAVVEFHDPEVEALQERIAGRLGYRLVSYRLELFGVP